MPLSEENQQTLIKYYEHTNVGDFEGALQYFTDDVTYWLPDASPVVPYAGEWLGKKGASEVYAAFGKAFELVDMTEIGGVATADEMFSINDEIFVARTTAQPWRLGVIHHIRFRDGLIARLGAYLDLAAAHEALSGRTPLPSPLLPPTTFLSTVSPVAGVEDIVSDYFWNFPTVTDALDAQATVYIPGDPRRLRFAGTWTGREQLALLAAHWKNSVDADIEVLQMTAEHNSVVVIVRLRGRFKPTRRSVDIEAAVVCQVAGDSSIHRVAWYLNTYPFVALGD